MFLQFIAKVGDKAQTAKDRGLDRTCGSLLQKLCQKYDNLAEVDKLASVTKKVETVKLVMQENVDIALQNCVKLETIERAAGIYISISPISFIVARICNLAHEFCFFSSVFGSHGPSIVDLFVCLSICLPVCLSIYLSTCLSVYLSVCLFVCLSVRSICIRTEELQQQAGVFKRNANELKKKMWWKNIKV